MSATESCDQVVQGATQALSTRKPYVAPSLTVFGSIGVLTQSSSGCSDNDSFMCSTPLGTMGTSKPA